MPGTKYRLGKVAIEGFKGFRERQEIKIGGKPTFIFGENGQGKSSIVEAIIWCLFGAEHRQGSVVRNVLYGGPCIVELELLSPEGTWRLRRVLPPGQRESTIAVTNPANKQVNYQDLFNVTRIAHGEGATIVLAQQQDRERRIADVSNFGMALCTYLGIDLVPRVMGSLAMLRDTALAQHDDLVGRHDEIKGSFDQQLQLIQAHIDETHNAPPWDEGNIPPTRESTYAEIKHAYGQACGLMGAEQDPELSALQELVQTSRLLKESRNTQHQTLGQQLRGHQAHLELLTYTRNSLGSLAGDELSYVEDMKTILADTTEILENEPYSDIEDYLEALEDSFESAGSLSEIRRLTANHVERWSSSECPACKITIDPEDFQSQFKQDHIDNDLHVQIRDQIDKARELLLNQGETQEKLDEIPDRRALILSGSPVELPDTENNTHRLEKEIEETEELVEQLETSISKHESPSRLELQNQRLNQEMRYHQMRSKRDHIQGVMDQSLDEAESKIRNLGDQIKSLEKIREVFLRAFDTALDSATPGISDRMTAVYQQLTQQLSFDKVGIVKGNMLPIGPELVLRVGSSSEPGHWHDPEQVLNGQAKTAIRLIPYFVFSSLDQQDHELDFLLIDDPSQSFDTNHIDLLVRLLKEATEHAQLVVATQEEDRFRPLVSSMFKDKDINIVIVEAFGPQSGPTITVNT